MPKLAHDIVIDHEKKLFSLDGQEFPWHILLEDANVTISPYGVHKVELSVLFDGSLRVWGKPAAE